MLFKLCTRLQGLKQKFSTIHDRGSLRPLPGPSHLSISGFALGLGFAHNSGAHHAPIQALPSILGRFRPSIEASLSILGRNLDSVRALPSIYSLRNVGLVAPLGKRFGRKHGTVKWDWNGYCFHTGTCFFPIRALGIIMPTVVEPSTRLQPSIKLHAPIRAFMFSCFGTQCLTPDGWRLRKPKPL